MKINIWISETNADRLLACKDAEGKHALTAGEYAEELLERELRRLFPAIPAFDETGKLTNGDAYRG